MKLDPKYLVYFLLNMVILGKKIYHYLINVFTNRNLHLLAEMLNKLAQNLNLGKSMMSLLWWLLWCLFDVTTALTFVYDQLNVIEMNNLLKVVLPCNCTSCRISAIIFLVVVTFWPTRPRPNWWSLVTCLQACCSSVCLSVHPSSLQNNATIHMAWWITKFTRLVSLSDQSIYFVNSGEIDVPALICYQKGSVVGNILDVKVSAEYNECLKFCKSDTGCGCFTYNKDQNICLEYSSCDDVDSNCHSCLRVVFGV